MDPATIASLVSIASSLYGIGKNLFADEPEMPYTREDIDEWINTMRSSGTKNIGRQVAQSNIAAAKRLSSRGLGDSTFVNAALGANEAAGLDALMELESRLAGLEFGGLQNLGQLQYAYDINNQNQELDFFESIGDLGLSYLFGKQGTGNNNFDSIIEETLNRLSKDVEGVKYLTGGTSMFDTQFA